jgi:lysophospholipase L1-like esterase
MGISKGGYIDRIQMALNEKKLQQHYQLTGAGVSGNKVYDLYLRLEEDILNKKPDVVVIWVGVNDVWHKTSGTGTDIEKYEKFYVAIIKMMQAKKIKLVLTTPAAIGEKYDGTNPQDKDLDAYSAVIRKRSTQFNCKLVDLRRVFMQYEKEHNTENRESGILTIDGVHLNQKGNQLVANQMWEALKNL